MMNDITKIFKAGQPGTGKTNAILAYMAATTPAKTPEQIAKEEAEWKKAREEGSGARVGFVFGAVRPL